MEILKEHLVLDCGEIKKVCICSIDKGFGASVNVYYIVDEYGMIKSEYRLITKEEFIKLSTNHKNLFN